VPAVQQTAPIYYVAGDWAGKVEFRRCQVKGLDGAPARGDFATFSVVSNPTRSASGHLKARDCTATKSDGSARWFRPSRETPE
jgi:hypothetical protein